MKLSTLMAIAALAFSTTSLRAESAACAAISQSDVASIVGTAPVKSDAAGCSWNADKDHFVKIVDNSPRSSRIEDAFNLSRAAAAKSRTVTDESGLGDRAYLSIASNGVAALVMLKKDGILQVQISVGSQPSAADLTLLRIIAAKAIAAF